jgi:crotonobetainyl-CoA:carnitine CoA-transferase CaiB-like acyl-CoA transferase
VYRAAPAFGEHSSEVLIEAGFEPSEVAALRDAGVVIEREAPVASAT